MHKMKHKHIVIIITVMILIAMSSIFVARFIYINQKYPSPTLETVNLNKPIKYLGFEIKVEKSKLIRADEIKKISSKDKLLFQYNSRALLVTINLKNTSKEKKKIDITPFEVESSGWRNAINLELFTEITSNGSTMHPTIDAGKEITLVLPFTMLDVQFTKNDWDNIDNRKFDLVLSLYPVKKSIQLYST